MSEEDLRDALPGMRIYVAVQDGAGTRAPAYIAADADYEAGDGNCGLHEDEKRVKEPAIIYVRADRFMSTRAERDALAAEVERLRTALAFYADPAVYQPHPHGPAFDRRDLSHVACAALAQVHRTRKQTADE